MPQRIMIMAFLSAILLLRDHKSLFVSAVEVDRCVVFCARLGIRKCVSFCRFFHRIPTESDSTTGNIDFFDNKNGSSLLDSDRNGNYSTNEVDNSTHIDTDKQEELVSRQDVSKTESELPTKEPTSYQTESSTTRLTFRPTAVSTTRQTPVSSTQIPSTNPDVVSRFPTGPPTLIPTRLYSSTHGHIVDLTTTPSFYPTMPPKDMPSKNPTRYPVPVPASKPTKDMLAELPTRPPTPVSTPSVSIRYDMTSKSTTEGALSPTMPLAPIPPRVQTRDPTTAPTVKPTKDGLTVPPTTASITFDTSKNEDLSLRLQVPACDFSKKVSYHCGDDTFVCNTDEYFSALEVCDRQPVPANGALYDWKDSSICNEEDVASTLNVYHNMNSDCWCKSMELGVLIEEDSKQALFPRKLRCPNLDYIKSYVCYFPVQGGSSYKVNQWDEGGDGTFVEVCSGFQNRNSLPPVQEPTRKIVEAP